jgi:tetratricopeptide (TPR) repeat protein
MDNDRVIAVVHNPTPADAAGALADELAFRIMSSDPKLAAAGMTSSWEAFQPFKQGLEQYSRYANMYDMAALSSAIDLFRDATRKDPSFAQAYYYLGLALQKDWQPGASADAFRTSLNTNANFAAAYNALAYHLYYYDQSYVQTAASVSPIPPAFPSERRARIEEARRLWYKALSLPTQAATLADRASAYYGLCSDALDRAEPRDTQPSDDYWQPATQDGYNLAYFYCQQAERLYAVLSSEQRASPQIKQGELRPNRIISFKRGNSSVPDGFCCRLGGVEDFGSRCVLG